jgi:UPF0755 protein
MCREVTMADSVISKNKKTATRPEHKLLRKIIRQTAIYLISIGIVAGTVTIVANTAYKRYFLPIDAKDTTTVEIEVPMGTTVSGIAEILYEKGLIRSTGVFKLMVDLSNKANRMQAGKYELSKSMTIQDMINKLLTGQLAVSTKSITIREGEDIRKIASRLSNEYKLPFTEEEFIKAAKNIDTFIPDFPFLQDIPEARRQTDYPLEGYLFPNTYYVYADDKPNNIIRTMLKEFERNFTVEMQERAKALNLTNDQVVTLASIIQNEGKVEEFEKISAVFHNRLKIGMRLESCATVNYILPGEINQTNLTLEDTKTESPYNTYLVDGLPLGPISSPGKDALNAALYPFEEFMNIDKPMLYFVLMDPEVGHHAFNSNYEDHVRDKAKYEKLWK